MSSHRVKLSYAVSLAVAEIVRTSRAPTFDTFTFAENVIDKLEASKRWRRLKARLKRHYPGLRAVGVWQRQERGAWHFHCVFDRRLDVNAVRPWAMQCGFGPQLNMRAVGDLPGMKRGWSAERVARYLTRYITRDVCEGDTGVRLVDYCGDSRKATTAFRWGGGIAALYRRGCVWMFGPELEWSDVRGPRVWDTEQQRWLTLWEGFWSLVRLGWETLDEFEKAVMLEKSDAVAIWLDPERYPF